MAVTFDTLKAATRLREQGGFSEKQATELVATFADGFVENLATKDDVALLRCCAVTWINTGPVPRTPP